MGEREKKKKKKTGKVVIRAEIGWKLSVGSGGKRELERGCGGRTPGLVRSAGNRMKPLRHALIYRPIYFCLSFPCTVIMIFSSSLLDSLHICSGYTQPQSGRKSFSKRLSSWWSVKEEEEIEDGKCWLPVLLLHLVVLTADALCIRLKALGGGGVADLTLVPREREREKSEENNGEKDHKRERKKKERRESGRGSQWNNRSLVVLVGLFLLIPSPRWFPLLMALVIRQKGDLSYSFPPDVVHFNHSRYFTPV